MFIPKNSQLWEIQELDDNSSIYQIIWGSEMLLIFVVRTFVGPLMNLLFLKKFQLSNG